MSGRICALTGQMKESEDTLRVLKFLDDESVNFNQTFCEDLYLSAFQGTFSLHGLSSVVVRDTDSRGTTSHKSQHIITRTHNEHTLVHARTRV